MHVLLIPWLENIAFVLLISCSLDPVHMEYGVGYFIQLPVSLPEPSKDGMARNGQKNAFCKRISLVPHQL